MKKLILLFTVVAMCASTTIMAQDGSKKASETKAKTECPSTDKKDADKKCCADSKKECDKKDADKKCCNDSKKTTADANKSCGKK